jgi:hypothetical protein
MKILATLLFSTLISLSSYGNTFVVKKSKKIDFQDCQENQNRFYSKVMKKTDSQIDYLYSKIEENRHSNDKGYQVVDRKYKNLLHKTTLKKIILQKVINQFNSRSLSAFMKSEIRRRMDAYNRKSQGIDVDESEFVDRDFIAYQNIKINLNEEIDHEIEETMNDKFHGLKEFALEEFKAEIRKELLKDSYHLYSQIAAGVFVQMSRQAVRSVLLNIGSSLFISALKGSVVAILTEPLYGSRALPEKYWTDLLVEYNELLLVPDWMKKAHVGDGSPWNTHCSAIAHRAGFLEESIKAFLDKDNAEFMKSIKLAGFNIENVSLNQELKKTIDGTMIRKPIILPFNARRVD